MNFTGKLIQEGMTLLELMITLTLMGILLSIGVPAMLKFGANIRLVTQANDLVADIVYSRNEAATRGRRVSMCVSQNVKSSDTGTNRSTCAANGTSAWATGRIIFVDMNGNGIRDVTNNAATHDLLLKKVFALPAGYSLTVTGFADTAHLTFSTFGGLTPTTAGSFKVCSTANSAGYRIAVAATGQPLSTKVNCP